MCAHRRKASHTHPETLQGASARVRRRRKSGAPLSRHCWEPIAAISKKGSIWKAPVPKCKTVLVCARRRDKVSTEGMVPGPISIIKVQGVAKGNKEAAKLILTSSLPSESDITGSCQTQPCGGLFAAFQPTAVTLAGYKAAPGRLRSCHATTCPIPLGSSCLHNRQVRDKEVRFRHG